MSSSSVHVAVRRVHIAQLDLLILSHTNNVALRPGPVLRQECDVVRNTAGCAEAYKAETDTVSAMEKGGGIRRFEAVTCDDTRAILSASRFQARMRKGNSPADVTKPNDPARACAEMELSVRDPGMTLGRVRESTHQQHDDDVRPNSW